MEEQQYFKLTTEDGVEQTCRVIITFDADDSDKSYVVFTEVDEDGNESVGEISALTYELNDQDEMVNFKELETEAEWEMVNEVLGAIIQEYDDDDNRYFTVTDENGEDIDCEVMYTFYAEEFDKYYVLYMAVSDLPMEERELYAASFTPGENGEIVEIFEIEAEEEWEVVEKAIDGLR